MSQWKEITTIEQWVQCLQSSKDKPLLLLKHSTRCPVSTNALQEFEQYIAKSNPDSADYVLVKVIESRPVSNQIAVDLNIEHASPQIFLIKDKASYWNTSHWSITTEHISAVVD